MSASAALIWDWSLDAPVQVVSPTDSVIFRATLHNDIASTEYVYGANIRNQGYWVSNVACCTTQLGSQYTLNNPGMGGDVKQSPNFFSQFDDLRLAPGESFEFVFLYLTPKYGTASVGQYNFTARLGLSYLATGAAPVMQYSQTAPSVIVSTVPQPPAILLLLSGMAPLLAYRRSQKACSRDIL